VTPEPGGGPSRRDRTRPAELLGLAAVFALFVGGGVLLSTREWLLALVFAGGSFVVSIVILATLQLATSRDVRDDEPPDGGRLGH